MAGRTESGDAGVVPVVLCGGGGTRLWPKSRGSVTKPFFELPGGSSLLGKTYSRISGLNSLQGAVTVSSAQHVAMCEREWSDSGVGKDLPHLFVGEPAGRNTAPAVALAAAFCAARHSPGTIMAVLPADHLVRHEPEWVKSVEMAAQIAAARQCLVLLGIMPTCAAIGYGYLQKGGSIDESAHEVERFVEKPDHETAQKYLASGEYLWNAGIFIGLADTFLEEIGRHEPEMAETAKSIVEQADSGSDKVFPSPDACLRFRDISFDVAVAERTSGLAMVVADKVGWSDVGSWGSFASELLEPDSKGNRSHGGAHFRNCNGCVYWGDDRVAVLSGLSGVCVIDDGNAVLVSSAGEAEQVGQISKDLADAGSDPPTVPKPWGSYTVLSQGEGYKVKRIDIRAGARLSLQSHRRRSEHWTTVLGIPIVTIEGREFAMPVDQSCHIPAGAKHRIANGQATPAAIIEVQVGDYLGEDDITRHEDDYCRP